MRYASFATLLFPVLLAGCSGKQSLLEPAGIQASRISSLWWLYFVVCLVVYVLVIAFIVLAYVRRDRSEFQPEAPVSEPPPEQEHRKAVWVGAAMAVTILILFALLIAEFMTGRAIESLSEKDAVVIKVIGHQWWWEVRYEDPQPSNAFTTANEIHIPVGRTVRVELDSTDVIHSFWVPNLHGKKDMIPGHPTHTILRADAPGEYWGQCAEFCGLQHAKMKFVVIAEPEDEFNRWLEHQRQPAEQPTTDSQQHGRKVFENRTCATCHTIDGILAYGRVGPPLTHIASRRRLAAGSLPNTRGHLGGWIVDPQSIKPGVRMPLNSLKSEDFHALLDYLENLK